MTKEEHDYILRLAIRYFYGGHHLGDDAPCPACDNWAKEFDQLVAKFNEANREGV